MKHNQPVIVTTQAGDIPARVIGADGRGLAMVCVNKADMPAEMAEQFKGDHPNIWVSLVDVREA